MCMLDMIDLSGRIQRLKEIKITENGYPSVPTSEWPSDVESEIIEGMKDADREIMRTIEMLGMIPVLEKGNVIKKYGDRLVYLNRDVEILLNRIEDCPVDETQIIDIDDILDIDNDVFLQSVEQQEREKINFALTDFAAWTAEREQTNSNKNTGLDYEYDSDDEDNTYSQLNHLNRELILI